MGPVQQTVIQFPLSFAPAASAAPPKNGLTAGVSMATSRSATSSSGDGREDRDIEAILDTTITHNIAEEVMMWCESHQLDSIIHPKFCGHPPFKWLFPLCS